LCQTNRPAEVVAFEPLPGLVEGSLQAHASHLGPPGRLLRADAWCNLLRMKCCSVVPKAKQRPIMRKAIESL
jgi:hypothetical protein